MPPERVTVATKAYLADQDSLGAWIEETCRVGPHEWDSSARLYKSWARWAERAGEKPGSMKEFSGQLQKKGFSQRSTGHSKTRGYLGLSVRDDTANSYLTEAD
jgi:phage/plasmid-associated DNA primase